MAQIEKSTMIRLRQAEGQIVTSSSLGVDTINGNYKVTLAKPVLLETGDTVHLHTAVLDSSAPNIVDIPEPVEVEIDVCRYINYYSNLEFPAGPPTNASPPVVGIKSNYIYERFGVDANPPVASPAPDPPNETTTNLKFVPTAARYWAGKMGAPAGGDVYKVTNLRIGIGSHNGIRHLRWGGIPLTFEYRDALTGNLVQRSFYIPKRPLGTSWIDIQPNVLIIGNDGFNSFTNIDSNYFLNKHNVSFPINNKSLPNLPGNSLRFSKALVPSAGSLYSTPLIETIKITIPPRRYQPAELCTVINDLISAMDLNGPTGMDVEDDPQSLYPIQNGFLGGVRQMERKVIAEDVGGVGHKLAFFREIINPTDDVGEYIEINTTKLADAHNDMWCGANQVQLNYDPVLAKLNWSILHFPIYVPLGGGADDFVPGVEWNDKGEVAPTYSGVTIMGLRPALFWTETMGFSQMVNSYQSQDTPFKEVPAQINKTVTPHVPYAPPASNPDIYPFKIQATAGVNVTDAFLGIDLPVTKDVSFFGVSNYDGANKLTATATSLTTPIFSTREFNVPDSDEGYFLVEIGFAFAQKMVGAGPVYNNIQSIVGKYFTSAGNFLQDQGSGSINYQHLGAPQMLTDISVRILAADGSLLPDNVLGPKNSIFLEILKTLNVPQPAAIKK